LNNSISLTLGW